MPQAEKQRVGRREPSPGAHTLLEQRKWRLVKGGQARDVLRFRCETGAGIKSLSLTKFI